MDQLDLFSVPIADGAPSSIADVLPFPMARRIGLIRDTAARLMRCKTKRSMQVAFDRVCLGTDEELAEAGVPQHRIRVEIDALADAVNAELFRLMQRDGRETA